MKMNKWMTVALVISVALAMGAGAEEKTKAQQRREKIDAMAKETLDKLLEEDSQAKTYYNNAYGYAVFDNIKLSLWISAGGGVGEAVVKKTGKRTYMKMGTAGLNIGLGGQKYQIVFFFQTKERFDKFVDKGWEADASANAVAATVGVNAEATFRDGMAFYQITQAGLMLQADVAGTKYWKSKKLNKNK